jgi:hypothetical protein
MKIAKLTGRRAFVSKRCSTKGQAGTSLHNQDTGLEQLLVENQVVVVDQHDLAGVTGSVPGARGDIDEIIRKKREGLDFDLLILPNTDRFTRCGSFHGGKLLWDLQGAGITVFFAYENLWSDDRYHQMLLAMLFDAARQTAVAISRGSTSGNTNSFLEGRSPHAKAPPFGLDRMYSADGKDLFILRNLPDGTQEMCDPATGDLIRTFDRNPERGSPAHYKKQKNEQIRLIPGNPLHVVLVVRIMEQLHVCGRASNAIAKELNDEGRLSPAGVEWSPQTVRDIAFNPAFVGILAKGQTTMAVYHTSARGAPIEARRDDPMELRDSPRPRRRRRPFEEWILREDPALTDYLPESIREATRIAIHADMRRRAASKPRSRDRHRQSPFILKEVLRSRQGGHRLTGRIGGRRNQARYYQFNRARSSPRTDHPLKAFIPAAPLERAVLAVLREILVNHPDIQGAVQRALKKRAAEQDQGSADRVSLDKELKRRQRQIVSSIESLTGDETMDRPIQDRLSRYREDLARLSAALRASPQPPPAMDVDLVADRIANELAGFADNLSGDVVETVRQIVNLLVGRMEADMETKEVEFDLQIPDWLAASLTRQPGMGLVAALGSKSYNDAQRSDGAEIAAFRCQQSAKRPVCYECERICKAA